MRYCKKCVQLDTRSRIYFDKDGACLYQEETEGDITHEFRILSNR